MKECPLILLDAPLVAVAVANDGTKGTLSIGLICTACIGKLDVEKGREVISDELSLVCVTEDTTLGDLFGSRSGEEVEEMPEAALAGDLIN